MEDLQAELAKEEAALEAVGAVSSPNTEMKRPVVQHHEQRIIALKEAIASKGSSWYNLFSWGKKGGRRTRRTRPLRLFLDSLRVEGLVGHICVGNGALSRKHAVE